MRLKPKRPAVTDTSLRNRPMQMAQTLRGHAKELFPGVAVALIVAVTAQFLAEHYATPAMLLALLLGIAVSFLGEEGKTVSGIAFSARRSR